MAGHGGDMSPQLLGLSLTCCACAWQGGAGGWWKGSRRGGGAWGVTCHCSRQGHHHSVQGAVGEGTRSASSQQPSPAAKGCHGAPPLMMQRHVSHVTAPKGGQGDVRGGGGDRGDGRSHAVPKGARRSRVGTRQSWELPPPKTVIKHVIWGVESVIWWVEKCDLNGLCPFPPARECDLT